MLSIVSLAKGVKNGDIIQPFDHDDISNSVYWLERIVNRHSLLCIALIILVIKRYIPYDSLTNGTREDMRHSLFAEPWKWAKTSF